MKKDVVIKVVKIAVSVAGVLLPLAQGYFADKDLNQKITEEVTKALKNQTKES